MVRRVAPAAGAPPAAASARTRHPRHHRRDARRCSPSPSSPRSRSSPRWRAGSPGGGSRGCAGRRRPGRRASRAVHRRPASREQLDRHRRARRPHPRRASPRSWAVRSSVSGLLGAPGQLAALPDAERAWMALSPLVLAAAVASAARTGPPGRLSPRIARVRGPPRPRRLRRHDGRFLVCYGVLDRGRGPAGSGPAAWAQRRRHQATIIALLALARRWRRRRPARRSAHCDRARADGAAIPSALPRLRSGRGRGRRRRRRRRGRAYLPRRAARQGRARLGRRGVLGGRAGPGVLRSAGPQVSGTFYSRARNPPSATRSATRRVTGPARAAAGDHAPRLRRQPRSALSGLRRPRRSPSGSPARRCPRWPWSPWTAAPATGTRTRATTRRRCSPRADPAVPRRGLGAGRGERAASASWASRWAATAPCCWRRSTRT